MEAQKTIVLHPGSQNLRIGRASDLNPITILHAIGYRRRQTNKDKPYHDTYLPSLVTDQPKLLQSDFEEQRRLVAHTLQSYVPPTERRRSRVATPPQQIATYNRNSLPEEIPAPPHENQPEPQPTTESAIFDNKLLQLTKADADLYNIHFPIRRGDLNLHKHHGGSLASVLAQLEAIWIYALEARLGIMTNTLPHYSAVLIISDVYQRSHLREFVTLLLQRMRFRACFLLQDHVAATYGAGLGYACVVDIGDQKCSISCVDDAISQPDTRVRFSFGGGDVSQVFLMLLRKCAFPYKDCNVDESYADAVLITQLKERFCHLKPEICGAHEKTFEVRKMYNNHLRYTLQVGDECLIAPLAFFHTELFNITGKSRPAVTQLHSSLQNDAEDCFDAEYLRETGRRNGGRDQLLDGALLPVPGDGGDDELVVVDGDDTSERDISSSQHREKEEQLYISTTGQLLSLELAIIRSIDRCLSEEMKRKMYSCILLVGGGIKFPGFANWLERKIVVQLSNTRTLLDHAPIEVNVYTKEMDGAMISWKGAAIMSCLESALELWITSNEWEKYGLRILREKAPFIW